MPRSTSSHPIWRKLLVSILAWMLATLIFSLVRLYGIEEEALYQLQASRKSIWEAILWQGLAGGALFGFLFGSTNLLLDHYVSRKAPYWMLLTLRVMAHVIVAIALVSLFLYIPRWVRGASPESIFSHSIVQNSLSRTAGVWLIFTGLVSIIFNLLRQIDGMFGPGIMMNILAGKYHRPQEEARIFMFLDLRSSTTYAERLGHVLYSELIQDCFEDLTEAVQAHQAQIYQYVGDEAVLTWPVQTGLKDYRCLEAFFTFERSIQARADYYFNRYDLVPAFKAGVNMGMVMVAEVGVVKKEIAYHSDVLSTAARIQSQCNRLGQRLLISGEVYSALPSTSTYQFREEGSFTLRGKKQEITLYSVSLPQPIPRKYEFSE